MRRAAALLVARALEAAGYHVCNVSYPSREHSIEVLTKDFVLPAVRARVHFVTREAELMAGFCVVPASHPFIMKNRLVIEQTLAFLAAGAFTCRAEPT